MFPQKHNTCPFVFLGATGGSNTTGIITISGSDVDLSNGKIVAGNAVDITATQLNINNSTAPYNGIAIKALNGSIFNDNGKVINSGNTRNVFLSAGKNITNTNGQILGDGKNLLRGDDITNVNGQIISKDNTYVFVTKRLYNTGRLGSEKAMTISAGATTVILNTGTIVSNDVLTINNPLVYNIYNNNYKGIIASNKEVSIFSSALASTDALTGIAAPIVLINGYNPRLTYRLVPYMVGGVFIHWILEAGSYVPVYGGAFTGVDAAVYGLEGKTAEAKAKLLEMPIAFLGFKGEVKAVNLAGEALKVEEKVIAKDLVKGSSDAWLETMIKEVSLGRGSTGRVIPNTLNEQIAMRQILSNPLENATTVPIKLTDSRWLAEEGWIKMQKIITTSSGEKVIVHFDYNTITKLFDDFKFVN